MVVAVGTAAVAVDVVVVALAGSSGVAGAASLTEVVVAMVAACRGCGGKAAILRLRNVNHHSMVAASCSMFSITSNVEPSPAEVQPDPRGR